MNNYSNLNNHFVAPYTQSKESTRKKRKEREKQLKKEVIRAGRTEEVKERERQLLSNPTNKTEYVFRCTNNQHHRVNFTGIEFTQYHATPNQPIIHGVVEISEYAEDGTIKVTRQEDIYVYQPRFEGRGGFVLGPRYVNGRLNNNAAYLFKDEAGRVFAGNIPKREVVSNMQFDFDLTNEENYRMTASKTMDTTNSAVKKFINIKYDRDSQGYIRPVNLSNREEYSKLNAYLRKNSTPTKAEATLKNYLQVVSKQLSVAEQKDEAIERSVRRVDLLNELNEQELQQAAASEQKPNLAEENARLINNMLKYGIKPTYASPGRPGMPHPGMPGPGMPPPPPNFDEPGMGPRR